jgi:hypothetical protein
MKRIQEKVKDLIEVRPYKSLQDFISDPAKTLSGYHFTDVTSDLMAKWLDAVADVQFQNGATKALAGYRGVGKSHFLATLSAIVSHPELRSGVANPLVAAGAQRLKRRRYPVAHVKRGTHSTLLEEIKAAIAKTFEMEFVELTDSVPDLLKMAAETVGDVPFILIIDTASERETRVSRDDGVLLGEIAEFSKNLNIFIAVALDDDIAGADGVNAAIVRNYAINYLDQEHLYNIVDTHIFPKHGKSRLLLHEIYNYFRQTIPSFRWSEQRFTSLYPLHPVILEIAPFVRLYVPDFALLGFAADAGTKILGRPASSLVALDEVFDLAENPLRKVEALKEAFAIYDKINTEVIGQIPVMQRLQAKLILKALLLLSLESEGATAGEIGAAMLIYDENEPSRAITEVEGLLEKFVSVFPDDIARRADDGREARFCLKVSSKDNLNNALSEAIQKIPPTIISLIMRRMSRERFPDWIIPADADAPDVMDCHTLWRGGNRRGRISWDWNDKATDSAQMLPVNSEFLDWEIIVVGPNRDKLGETFTDEVPKVFWQPARLRPDEEDAILRFYVLLTDESLREQFGDQIRAAGHAHTLAVEKVWTRIFLDDAKLFIDGLDIKFTDEAKSAQSLSEMFSIMLEPLFEARFPNHPYFLQTIGMAQVSSLVNDLFSGARANLAEVQELAKTFALPLGLVDLRGDLYILETEENLVNLPLAKEILNLVAEGGGETVSLKTIYKLLKKEPFGLTREAQHLILTALVAQRQVEFVTSKGDRINRRSLDLKIIWDDIVGVAKPSTKVYSNERLILWAKNLTCCDDFRSIDTPAEREMVRNALENWLNDWRLARVLDRFNELPDEIFNTKIWRIATNAEKTFGAVAETVQSVLNDFISLDEGLHRIADAFSDSETEFIKRTKELVVLEDFIGGTAKREEIWSYLAVCEPTQDEKIEFFREKLLYLLNETYHNPNEALNRELENLWQTFQNRFAEHFALKHDLVMKSHHLQEKFDEILRSDEWWEFENLSRLSIFHQTFWNEAQKDCRQFRELDCRFDVREMLQTHPFCACSFNLAQIREWEKLPNRLFETVNRGRASYRRTLLMARETLLPIIEKVARNENEFAETAGNLDKALKDGGEIPLLTNDELIIIQKALETIPASALTAEGK